MNDGARGAKGGRNDKKRVLKMKLAYLKLLKKKNKINNKFNNIKVINLNYRICNPLVEGYKKYKVSSTKKDNKVFDGIIMITSLLTLLVPEKTKKTSSDKKLERLEEAKIVENYSEKLKDLRIELREESFENKLLENKEEDENIDLLVDNLNVLIDKVDVLEEKIKEEEDDKYDSDYLYVIVDDCLKDFADNKEVEDIPSSDLYIQLSNNIEKFKEEKEKIDIKLSDKKMELNITDEDINKMKEDYYKTDDFNEEMDKFAEKTDEVLSDAKDNLSDKNKLEKADKVSGLLLGLAAGEMLLPMNKDAKKLIVGTTITIFLLRELLFKDRFKLKKNIKEPIVDYSNKIDKDIASIDDKISSITKSINDIDMMISDLRNRYRNNSSSTEFINLLIKLERMKSLLNEKLYALLKQRNKTLMLSNAKVKTK